MKNVKKELPPTPGLYRIVTEAGCCLPNKWDGKYWDYDLICDESVSVVGMGTADRVVEWDWFYNEKPHYTDI